MLDGYLESLRDLRDEIEGNDRAALTTRLRTAQKKAYNWLAERHLEKYVPVEKPKSSDATESPSLGERVRQMFLGRLKLPGADRDKK